jgi:hypothetical protein
VISRISAAPTEMEAASPKMRAAKPPIKINVAVKGRVLNLDCAGLALLPAFALILPSPELPMSRYV